MVASRAAYSGAPEEGIQFGDLRATRDYSVSQAYGHSKLANVLFSYELARLLKGIEDSIKPPEPTEYKPVYDVANLVLRETYGHDLSNLQARVN